MTIDANSGAFSWTPEEADSGTHSVTITVTDDGAGTLFDSETFDKGKTDECRETIFIKPLEFEDILFEYPVVPKRIINQNALINLPNMYIISNVSIFFFL